MSTHTDLIVRLAEDAGAIVEQNSPSTLTHTDIGRLRYPHERAVEFLKISERRFPEDPALRPFGELVEVYGRLVDELERVRISEATPSTAGDIASRVAHVGELAVKVRTAISDAG